MYKNLPITKRDYPKIQKTKEVFESDFGQRLTWSQFVLILCVAYHMGKALVMNEDKFIIDVEEYPNE